MFAAIIFASSLAGQVGHSPLVNKNDLIRGELRTLMSVLQYKREVDKAQIIEPFSTKDPPKWCSDRSYIRKLLGKEDNLTFNRNYTSAFYRPWHYETTKEGTSADIAKLSDKVAIIVCIDEGSRVFGVTKTLDFVDYRASN